MTRLRVAPTGAMMTMMIGMFVWASAPAAAQATGSAEALAAARTQPDLAGAANGLGTS